MKPLINILIRTSNRPNYFRKCIHSIRTQSYHNYRIIVSVDDDFTEAYVKPYKLDYIRVKKCQVTAEDTAPYNLYLNKLMRQVDRGWILILDDDDHLAHSCALEIIAQHATSSMSLLIWQMTWPNGRVIPDDYHWGKLPQRTFIGMPCFAFHRKWVDVCRFDGKKAGDLRFFHQLFKIHINKIWIKEVLVKTGNIGLKGEPIDL